MKPTCMTCRFWLPDSDGAWGDCRRYPPAPLYPRPAFPIFPQTGKSDWCGEHHTKSGG
jgi:hypothetical protein